MHVANFIGQGGHFLMLGFDDVVYEALRDRGWTGVVASNPGSHGTLDKRDLDGHVDFVEGWMHPGNDFIRRLDGLYVKSTTPWDVIQEFDGKPFDMAVLCLQQNAREFLDWFKGYQDAPVTILFKDDGKHNNIVAWDGYSVMQGDMEWLVFKRA